MKQKKTGKIVAGVATGFAAAVLVVAAVAVGLNWQWWRDFLVGTFYEMPAEVADIKNSLRLTERGEFLLKAAQPELNDSAEFNANCRTDGTETAILGCYKDERIFVYNIDDESLAGIRETTTAHELLHAVFARMSEAERENLKASLEAVLKENDEVLAKDLANYDESEQFEELYVRAGTEVKNLTADLEAHYGEFFEDQDAVVDFYEGYIKVFRDLKNELDQLEQEITPLGEQIKQELDNYGQELAQLNADIVSFNACAETAGCFSTTRDFYSKRSALVTAQQKLNKKYDELSEKINQYNEKVKVYNEDVLRGQDLNKMINSNSRPNEI